MEGLKSFYEHLKDLQPQGKRLIETMVALNALFAEEDIRQKREDEVSILTTLRGAIAKQLQELKGIETAAGLGHTEENSALLPVRLALAGIFLKDNLQSAIKDYVFRGADDKHRSFGTVMVCVGPKGLPDDARALSISKLVRESNRPQPEVVNSLRENGYLLFSEETFSYLIDRLAADVRQGKLRLPVSREKLADIAGLNKPASTIKIMPIK
jgi:hypothetical protein